MSEEEIELRDLVAQTLENKGVLSRIRAELRASVFLALEEQESVEDAPEFANKTLKAFLSSDEGSLVACLVREFLEFFQLDFTLSVFDPETAEGKYYSYGGRTKLMKDLHIENWNGKKGPLLVQVLHRALNQNADSSSVKKDENKPHCENSTETSSVICNPTAQTITQLDSDIPDNNIGDRTSATQLQIEFEITKDNSSNTLTERKSVSSTEDSKQLTETNQVPRSKGIILPAAAEETSPQSPLVSESKQASRNSKEASKSKTVSSETTPHNSPTLEQPETQAAPNSDSIQNNSSKSDCKQLQPQKTSKPNVEPLTKAGTSTLSSLNNLPPLIGVNPPMKQAGGSLTGISQPKDMHQIKAMIDIGLESQDNYDEDFNSSVSVSAKEDIPNQGTDTEIEEELGSGVEDLLSSNSALDDLTADATLSNLTGVADYMEDVK